jgi:Family of unknown function (DUF6011)
MAHQMRQMTVFSQGMEHTFSTPYSDDESLNLLRTYVMHGRIRSDFARSLVNYVENGRNHSQKQTCWVHKLAVDYENSVASKIQEYEAKIVKDVVARAIANVIASAKRENVINDVNDKNVVKSIVAEAISNIIAKEKKEDHERQQALLSDIPSFATLFGMMKNAALKLKQPKIVFNIFNIRLQFNWNNWNETISVECREMAFYATICTDKIVLKFGSLVTEDIVSMLKNIANDPILFVQKYGLGTGKCCFCNRQLCDDRSIAVGYGMTCAQHYCMPWGSKRLKVVDVLLQ